MMKIVCHGDILFNTVMVKVVGMVSANELERTFMGNSQEKYVIQRKNTVLLTIINFQLFALFFIPFLYRIRVIKITYK